MSGNSAETEGASTFQSPIACESCRQRKRRCDRKLPFCLQCSHEPGRCQYPEQSKRGIPNGYLNKLETRLAETEAALFRALSATLDGQTLGLDSASSPALLSQPAWTPRQNKVDRVKEWESLPLQTPNDVQVWFRSKAAETGDPAAAAASPQSLISSVSDHAAVRHPSREPASAMPSPHIVVDMAIEPQFIEPMTPINVAANSNRGMSESLSKAKELSNSHKNLYF